ncbi:unnamed protein product [Camellia sinensis]
MPETLGTFSMVKKICPNEPDATKKLKECEKAVMKLKFEEAIVVPESERRSIVDSIDFHSIARTPVNQVEPQYAFQIVLQTREMLCTLPSLVDINIPDGKHFTVCGDVHGQCRPTWNIPRSFKVKEETAANQILVVDLRCCAPTGSGGDKDIGEVLVQLMGPPPQGFGYPTPPSSYGYLPPGHGYLLPGYGYPPSQPGYMV